MRIQEYENISVSHYKQSRLPSSALWLVTLFIMHGRKILTQYTGETSHMTISENTEKSCNHSILEHLKTKNKYCSIRNKH